VAGPYDQGRKINHVRAGREGLRHHASPLSPDTFAAQHCRWAALPEDQHDIGNGLIAIPNLIGLLLLVGVVYRETMDCARQKRAQRG
jgi:hypothetical protein